MNKKKDYADDIVSGRIPQQESFTQEEVKEIIGTMAAWCAEQIEHDRAELFMTKKDATDMVRICEFKTPVEALVDNGAMIDEQLGALAEFIRTYHV